MASEGSRPLREAVEEAAKAAESAAPGQATPRRRGRPSDVFGGEIRRRDVFPLLVLHLIRTEPSYGNHLIEAIEEITQGVVSVNPNTMYPLLRQLESRGLIQGKWEHPERRTRRNYEITAEGRAEFERLNAEVRPFLDAARASIDEIVREVYG